MQEVLRRLEEFNDFEIIIFGNDVILHKPIEQWPNVEVLITFFSGKFPMEKAIQYINLRRPLLVNNLECSKILFDRKLTYKKLEEVGVAVPSYAIIERDHNGELLEGITFEEDDDIITVNGKQFHKPFVEKPLDAEDHNIRIYYPASAGGGCTTLFRKIGDKSSEFLPEQNCVRKDCSYLYEEFLPTEGTDVKVYKYTYNQPCIQPTIHTYNHTYNQPYIQPTIHTTNHTYIFLMFPCKHYRNWIII